jgi:hypothetical protein
MKQPEFDASEIIAGFPLTEVKRALAWVGVMPDRDDIENVQDALNCPPHQAERLLEALENRGFVVKTAKDRQWDTTQLGHQLTLYWKPPRRMHPAIEREEESGIHSEGFESVPCFVYRSSSDDGVSFEECEIDVGLCVQFENDRVIEINVVQPDFYDDRNGSSTIEQSVYIGIDDARKLAKGLETAIERADRELARRKATLPRPRARAAESDAPPKTSDRTPETEPSRLGATKNDADASSRPTQPATRPQPKPAASALNRVSKQKRAEDMLAATLKELGRK